MGKAMIDLSNPAHAEALRWACTLALKADLPAMPTADTSTTCAAACRVITTPSLAAPLVRDLLLLRYPASTRHLIDVMHWRAHDHAKEACLCGKSWPEHVNVTIGAGLWTITAERLPALILALLDATTPEAALDALRKAGR
jgi:hypothetical protein